MSDKNWKEELTSEQYRVMREQGTEAPFSGKYVNHHEDGVYRCAGCGAPLFTSSDKFDSGTGWPSFDKVASSDAVELRDDNSHGMHRVEVRCKACGSHLGHVFPDGPSQTGERFCINSCALDFEHTRDV